MPFKKILFFSALVSIICTNTSADEITKKAQNLLNNLGYNAGSADGIYGRKTNSALQKFYNSKGQTFDGNLDEMEISDLIEAVSNNGGRVIANTHFEPVKEVANLYKNYDRYINKHFDFPSLRIQQKDFNTGTFTGDNKTDKDGYYLKTMIQYANSGDLDGDGNHDLVMGGWVCCKTNPLSRLHYVYFKNGVPFSTQHIPIEGTSAIWVGDFDKDKIDEVFTVGYLDFPVKPTNSYYFANGINSKKAIGSKIDSHESQLIDFDGDSDLDIIATTYGKVNTNISLFKNDNGNFKHEYLKISGNPNMSGSSVLVDDFDGDGRLELVIGDSRYGKCNNAICYFDLDLVSGSTYKVTLKQKLKEYFSDPVYRNITTAFNSSQNPRDHDTWRSHDIYVNSADLDNDGDKDLIVGSVLWNKKTPFGILQLFINDGSGKFSDQTNERLLNFQVSGESAHDMLVQDINGDGAVDIIMSDRNAWYDWMGVPLKKSSAYDVDKITSGNRMLINDGSGYFVSTHENIFASFAVLEGWSNSWYPVINKDKSITFTALHRTKDNQKDLWQYAKLKKPLSTGPFFTDPTSAGLPNFNEFYVLRTSSDARNAVLSGSYKTALDWYIATKPNIRTHANQK